jgi:hypothetical protein
VAAATSRRLAPAAAGGAAVDRFGVARRVDAGTAAEAAPVSPDCVPSFRALAALRRGRGPATAGVTDADAASEGGVDGDVIGGVVDDGAGSAGSAVGFLRRAISGLGSP